MIKKAVVNENGVVLYVDPITGTKALALLLRELGGVLLRPHGPNRVPVAYGRGLTKEIAKAVLTRRRVSFEDIESTDAGAAQRDPSTPRKALRSG